MASVEETERLGNGLSLIEALNLFLFSRSGESYRNTWVYNKIQKVINLMDEVLV